MPSRPGAGRLCIDGAGEGRLFFSVGRYGLLRHGAAEASLYWLVITGTLLSVLPVIALFLSLQRFWRIDLVTGALK